MQHARIHYLILFEKEENVFLFSVQGTSLILHDSRKNSSRGAETTVNLFYNQAYVALKAGPYLGRPIFLCVLSGLCFNSYTYRLYWPFPYIMMTEDTWSLG